MNIPNHDLLVILFEGSFMLQTLPELQKKELITLNLIFSKMQKYVKIEWTSYVHLVLVLFFFQWKVNKEQQLLIRRYKQPGNAAVQARGQLLIFFSLQRFFSPGIFFLFTLDYV